MKNLLRKGILYGTALAALAGCGEGVSSRNINGPEEEVRVENIGQAREKIINAAGDNEELAAMVNASYSKMLAAPKIAQDSEILQIPYNGRNPGDFDYNHEIDFDDFLLFADNFGASNKDYDLDGNGGIVDFDDFLLFADNFGRRVNSIPQVTGLESSNGNEANVGEEVEFSAAAKDRENDSLNYSWLINNEEIGVNGRILKRIFDKPGEYLVALKVSDSFGAQSNELSRVLNVQHLAPVLSLPNEISFPQWVSGQNIGNVHRLNLDDYVSDPNFNDSELTWNFEVENNEFEHNKENTAPYGQYMEFLLDSYRTEALSLAVNGGLLTIDPVGNYNSNDHGERYVNLAVTNPNSASANKRIKINIKRSAEFDDYYDDVLYGVGWKPEKAYVWVGPSRDSREPRDPRLWTGPRLIDEQKRDFESVIEQWPEQTDYNIPLEIIYVDVDNYQKIYNVSFENYDGSRGRIMTSDNSFIFYRDDSATPASADYGLVYDPKRRVIYSFMTIKARNSASYADLVHEMDCHGGPFAHSSDRSLDSRDSSICHYASTRETTKPRHKAAFDSFYEIFENPNTIFDYSENLNL